MNDLDDRILLDARDSSIQLEQIAVDDLKSNLGDYLEPNWRARKIVDGWGNYAKTGRDDEEIYFHIRAADRPHGVPEAGLRRRGGNGIPYVDL